MRDMNELLIKIFGIDNYEFENERLNDEIDRLNQMLQQVNETNKVLASDIIKLEKENSLLKEDPEQYIETEVERRTLSYEKEHECDMNHRWYGIGRQDAYREMGIRALESRKAGTTMYYIKDTGEVIEDITKDLEDLTVYTNETTTSDEIEIEDLT